jgi:hypothetical protein
LTAAGTYTLGIGVADEADEFIPPALAVDNFLLQSPITNTPPTLDFIADGEVDEGMASSTHEKIGSRRRR